jgi:hypothetical protein
MRQSMVGLINRFAARPVCGFVCDCLNKARTYCSQRKGAAMQSPLSHDGRSHNQALGSA